MIKNIIKTVLIVLVVVCGLFFFSLSNQIGGWRGFVVSSASMEPTLPVGSLVLTQVVQPSQLKPDDVITFIQPAKEKEFITHRISSIVQKDKPISFKTKGDNNSSEDNWILAGGGIVGKVMFSVPYLGYLLSFSQTKLGIVLFILIPAFWIVFDEILNIAKLVRNRKPAIAVSTETQAMLIALLFGISAFSISSTQAVLNDDAQLTANYFTVALAPTTTPLPTSPCGGNTVINVSGNGAGSTTNVSVVNNCSKLFFNSVNSVFDETYSERR